MALSGIREPGLKQIEERKDVDRTVFEAEIVAANRPVVMRGLLHDWPAVKAGRQSPERIVDYFKRVDGGGAISAMVGPPFMNGRFFYTDDYQSCKG